MSSDNRVIMGIDPGTNRTGYGLIKVTGNSVKCLVMGDIELSKFSDPYSKLGYIFERVSAIVDEYSPDEVALESPFFGENIQSMLKLGRAQGVAMAAALHKGIPVSEYAPRRIKQAITGNGTASKEQVASMLHSILGVNYDVKHLDATDGLAVAMCHYFERGSVIGKYGSQERVKALGGGLKSAHKGGSSSWSSFVNSNPNRVSEEKTKKK